MVDRVKLTAADWLNSPKGRVVFILGTLVFATLIGGAPHDGSR